MSEMQPMRERNVQAIVDYFESGIKPAGTPGRLGVELEHIVVTNNMEPVSYYDEKGIQWILEQLAAEYPDRTYDDEGDLLGVARPGQAITIEPAGQLELSAGPYEAVGEIRLEFEQFQRHLGKILAPNGMRALAMGYHPTTRAADLRIIPKQRYRFMDEHFSHIGDFGRCMMRGSAAAQVSIDYYSVDDCLAKLRLASILSPLFALLCDNSPVFEGAPRTHNMVRTEIWQKCDPARCGTVRGLLEPGFTLVDYANYLLDTPAIFAYGPDGTPFPTEQTFGEVYANRAMETADVEHVLSLFFNDARLKYYIEIRPADSMPVPFVAAYAALIKGLFYNEEALSELSALFQDVAQADVDAAKESLMADGFQGCAYGQNAGDLIDKLIQMALDALAKNEKSYLTPFVQHVKMRKTLADLAS